MEGSVEWRILLATIVLVHLTAGYDRPEYGTELAFTELPWGTDTRLLEQETNLVHIGNTGPERIFAFATYIQSNRTAVVYIVSALDYNDIRRDRRSFRPERCELKLNVPKNSEVAIDSLRRWYREGLYSATFSWHIKGKKKEYVSRVDSMTCKHAEWWRMDNLENPTDRQADLAKIEKPEGYYFVDEAHSNDTTVLIKYVNMTSASVRLAAEVPMSETSSLRRHSLQMNKYGVCWTGEKKITCAQGPIESKDNEYELDTWASIWMPNQPDFFGVFNYEEDKMLVIVGRCNENAKNCGDFELFEVRPDGTVLWHSANDFRMGECRDPRDVSVNGYRDTKRNRTCFDQVCDDKKSMKHRRICAG